MKKRLNEIDVLQGIAMMLVVLGHHFLDFMPSWYMGLHYYLYLFHMPLFIFISGFLIKYSYKGVLNVEEYKKYVWKRVKKFFPMYMLVGVTCILLSTDLTSLESFFKQLVNLMINPKGSPATFLWYIFLLFFYYCLSPILFNLSPRSLFVIFVICLLGFVHPSTVSVFCIDYFTKYSVFYLLGVWFAEQYSYCKRIVQKYSFIFLGFFVFLSICHFYYGYSALLEYIIPWIAIPTFYVITMIAVRIKMIDRFFTYISVHCFSIYLFHMFFVQAIAVIMGKICSNFSTLHYIIYLMISIFVSIMCSSKIYSLLRRMLPLD